MLNSLLKYFKYGSLYGAIEHQAGDNNNEQLSLLLLKKQQNEFSIETQQQFESINEVGKTVRTEQHLYLIVNNNQVLSKSIPRELNEDKALQKGYPTIKISEFYYEIIQLEKSTYIVICRKEYIQALINDYLKHDIHIIGVTLGNAIAVQLVPFMESSSILTSNASVSIANKQITSIKLNTIEETPYIINDLEISNRYTLALASIIAYYSNSIRTTSNFTNYNASILKKYTQKRFFNVGLKVGLGLLFTALLINFLFFDYYNKNIESLSQKTQINQYQKEQLLKIDKELNSKKKLVHDIINSTLSKTSFYLDEIGLSVPNTILLNSINYQPISKKIKDQKMIVLAPQIVLIKGSSSNGEIFSNWIKRIEEMNWIVSTAIVNYGTGKKSRTTFELKIILK